MSPPRTLSAQAVADLVGGRLSGRCLHPLTTIAPLDRAGPGAISMLTSRTYLTAFAHSRASLVLVRPADASLDLGPRARLIVDQPQQAMRSIVDYFFPPHRPQSGIHPTAMLGSDIHLGVDISIGPGVVLEDEVQIGDRVVLGPRVVLGRGVSIGDDADIGAGCILHEGTVLGARVRVKAGAVLGGEGFGYLWNGSTYDRIRHIGRCILEDDVDVGSHTCIDRGSIADTVIGTGTKLDNLVHIGHNVRVGAHCLLMAGVGIAGSAIIGDRVILAGHVGVSGHLTVGNDARIGAGSKVWSSVPAGASYSGMPAGSHQEHLRGRATIGRLTPMLRDVESLVRKHRGKE